MVNLWKDIIGPLSHGLSACIPLYIATKVVSSVKEKFIHWWRGKNKSNSYVLELTPSHYLYKPLIVNFINTLLRATGEDSLYHKTAINNYEVVSPNQDIYLKFRYKKGSSIIEYAIHFEFKESYNACDVYFINLTKHIDTSVGYSDLFHLLCINIMLFETETVVLDNLYKFISKFDIKNTTIRKQAHMLIFKYLEDKFSEHFTYYKNKIIKMEKEKLLIEFSDYFESQPETDDINYIVYQKDLINYITQKMHEGHITEEYGLKLIEVQNQQPHTITESFYTTIKSLNTFILDTKKKQKKVQENIKQQKAERYTTTNK